MNYSISRLRLDLSNLEDFFFLPLQATGLDRAAGFGMMLLSALIFTYYTIWIIVLVSMRMWLHDFVIVFSLWK